jgi:hypothetical protein
MHITNITKAKEEYKKQKDLIFGEIKLPNCMQLVKFFAKCCCESTKIRAEEGSTHSLKLK